MFYNIKTIVNKLTLFSHAHAHVKVNKTQFVMHIHTNVI